MSQNEQQRNSFNAIMKPAKSGKSLVTMCTYEERQEALKKTIIMEDEVSHRKTRTNTDKAKIESMSQHNMPPPPPQFANMQQSQAQHEFNGELYAKPYAHKTNQSNAAIYSNYAARIAQPPSSPTPDYDNVQIRNSAHMAASNNRHTMLLDSVSIGEYETLPARKTPHKFEFLPKRSSLQQGQQSLQSELQNTLNRSTQLKQPNGVTKMEHQSNCPLQNGHVPIATATTTATTTALRNGSSHGNGVASGGGILKHSSRIGRNNEKSISFGN